MSNEAFEKFCKKYANRFVNLEIAFQAGQVAEREAIVQHIIDQGTITVLCGIDVYFIADEDIEAIKARG